MPPKLKFRPDFEILPYSVFQRGLGITCDKSERFTAVLSSAKLGERLQSASTCWFCYWHSL